LKAKIRKPQRDGKKNKGDRIGRERIRNPFRTETGRERELRSAYPKKIKSVAGRT
jgi:hypothetical protein